MEEAMTLPTFFNPNTYWDTKDKFIGDKLNGYLGQFFSRKSKKENNTFTLRLEVQSGTTASFDENELSFSLDIKGTIDGEHLALENLTEVYSECSEENWDGYGALPISQQAYLEGNKLLRMIPSSFPMPDILPEPDGYIGFEWYKREEFSFTISLGGMNRIDYAGLFGENNETHGTEHFSDSVPRAILDNLKRLFFSTEL